MFATCGSQISNGQCATMSLNLGAGEPYSTRLCLYYHARQGSWGMLRSKAKNSRRRGFLPLTGNSLDPFNGQLEIGEMQPREQRRPGLHRGLHKPASHGTCDGSGLGLHVCKNPAQGFSTWRSNWPHLGLVPGGCRHRRYCACRRGRRAKGRVHPLADAVHYTYVSV